MTNTSDILALDDLYDAMRAFRRSDVLADFELDEKLSEVLHKGLTALVSSKFADRVMNTLDERPAATLVEVVTEILEEA